jgi:Ca-activated chloride channel family protein
MRRKPDRNRLSHEPAGGEDRERDWRLLVGGLLLFGFLVVLATAARAAGEAGTGALVLHTSSGDVLAPWLDTDVSVRVNGLIARVSVRQRFINDRPEWVEGAYAFPLPDSSAVHGLRMRIGDRVIEGEVREREAARAVYGQARAAGQRASIVEQSRPNVFRTSVANLAPYDTIEVELDYLQIVTYESGVFSLRFPMTITPRYEPPALLAREAAPGAGALENDPATLMPPVLRMEQDQRALGSIHVDLDAGFALATLVSAYHAIHVERDGRRYVVELVAGKVPMDRDFALTWRPDVGAQPAAAVFSETLDGEAYALVMLVPGTQRAAPPLRREMIFVIDTSGSMEGTALAQAKSALALAVQRLGPRDRFNVIEFNSTTSTLYDQPVPVDDATRAQALDYLAHVRADGGTEMSPALAAAFAGEAPRDYLRQIVFVTDGGIANEDGLFEQIRTQLGNARLFTVGIGAAPNAFFMRKAAELGRGDFTFIGSEPEVGATMQALLVKLESPALTDVEIDWSGAVEVWPARVPDLYYGSPVVMTARLSALAGRLILRGSIGNQPWTASLSLDGQQAAAGVATLWARHKIEALMDAERRGDTDAKREIIDVALRHQLVSAYTSFVAVDRTPARPMQASLQRRDVPNLLPAAQMSPDSIGYPQTATNARLRALVALALFALGTAMRGRPFTRALPWARRAADRAPESRTR